MKYKDQYGTWTYTEFGKITEFEPNENVTAVKIPRKINGVDITVVGWGTFKGNEQLVQVDIPNSIREIDDEAFSSCKSLTQVNIEKNGVKTIGNAAFYGCISLEQIDLPEGVESTLNKPFMDCIKLKQVNLPNTLKHIGPATFLNTKLKQITLPSGIEYIECSAFNCNFYIHSCLTQINIPSGVRNVNIDDGAFSSCYSLKSINISNKNQLYIAATIIRSSKHFPVEINLLGKPFVKVEKENDLEDLIRANPPAPPLEKEHSTCVIC